MAKVILKLDCKDVINETVTNEVFNKFIKSAQGKIDFIKRTKEDYPEIFNRKWLDIRQTEDLFILKGNTYGFSQEWINTFKTMFQEANN